MVCGVNSRQSVLTETEVVKPDGRFNTDVVLLPFGATGTFFDRTLGFGAEALRLLGFFFTIGTGREPIATLWSGNSY